MLSLKNDRLLRLIRLLSGGANHTLPELMKEIGASQRSIYYYLDYLRDNGFIVYRTGNAYRIDRRSPFIVELTRQNQFNDEELRTIHSVLMMMSDKSQRVSDLLYKLERAYDFNSLSNTPSMKRLSGNTSKLISAIQSKHVVKLVAYSSPHSNTVKDRIVEPYLLINGDQDVRCYELASGINKTFKIVRAKAVEQMDMHWLHEDKHSQMFTDIFTFSSPEHIEVKLRLDQLAFNLFSEEYPAGRKYIKPEDEEHWILNLEVCDFRGIGRFTLGLYEHVEILGNEDFKHYIADNIKAMAKKLKATEKNYTSKDSTITLVGDGGKIR